VVQGSDDRLFRAALELGARGVVIEGFGGSGTIPSWFLPTIAEARRRGVPIVLCARTSAGRVAFGAAASQVALKEAGIIPGGTLPSHKARLVLMAALANGESEEKLRDAFRAIAG
jgi:L-asparaginase